MFSKWDLDCLRDGALLDYLVGCCQSIGRDDVGGWLDDDMTIWGDWGFSLSGISVPVSIWQGGEDRIVPVAHGEWLAKQIPWSRFHLLPEAGHTSSLYGHYETILDELRELGA
jgi:pimeloyl-ACP methyl ester carboxylesterase